MCDAWCGFLRNSVCGVWSAHAEACTEASKSVGELKALPPVPGVVGAARQGTVASLKTLKVCRRERDS